MFWKLYTLSRCLLDVGNWKYKSNHFVFLPYISLCDVWCQNGEHDFWKGGHNTAFSQFSDFEVFATKCAKILQCIVFAMLTCLSAQGTCKTLTDFCEGVAKNYIKNCECGVGENTLKKIWCEPIFMLLY